MNLNFLYQITAACRAPEYGATAPRSPFSLSSTEFFEPPPKNKIPGYATAPRLLEDSYVNTTLSSTEEDGKMIVNAE